MESVSELLDHIAAKAEQLTDIDNVIRQIEATSDVFLSPSDRPGPDTSTAMAPSHERPEKQPRLKTLLFVLANEFGIEPGGDDLHIRRGDIDAAMMRREPYYEVLVLSLQRH